MLLRPKTWKIQQIRKNHLLKFPSLIIIMSLPYSVAFAIAYTNPGNAVAPQTLSTGDTFTNTSGLFQSTGSLVSSFGTVQVNSESANNTITISGGTVSATGSSTGDIPTVPLFGATTSSTTINLSAGGTILNNTAKASTVALSFVGPIVFTNSGGTVTGTITAGAGSTFTQTAGSVAGVGSIVTLGAASTVSLSNALAQGLVVGSGSTINLTGSASIGTILTGNGSTMNFSTGITPPATSVTGINTLNVNSGTFTLTGGSAYTLNNAFTIASGATVTISTAMSGGAASTTNAGTLTLGVANALPAGAITNSGTLVAGAAQTFNNVFTNTGTINTGGFTLANNGSITTSGNIIGAGTVSNAGTLTYNGGTLTTTLSNSGNLNISAGLTATSFTNSSSGSIFIYGATPGKLNHNVTAGTKIHFGQNSEGTNSTGAFSTGGTIAGVPIIRLFSGSLLVQNAITTLTNSFTIDNNTSATFTAALSGTGAFNNAGTVTVSVANAVGTSGVFTNSGNFNIASGGSWITGTYASINNTGQLFLANGGTLTVSAPVSLGGTLSVGRTSAGVNSNATFSAAAAFTIPSINVYNASTINGAAAISSNVYLCGTQTNPFTGTVSGSMLTIGMDSFGNTFTPTVTLNAAVTGFPALYVTRGTLTTSGAGTISNLNTALLISNGATFNIGAAISGATVAATNSGTVNLAAALNLTSFANASGAVLNLNNGASIPATTTINNYSSGNGVNSGINVGTTTTNAGIINNYGTMTYLGTMSGAGVVRNQSGGTLTFSTSASNANPITNFSGATFEIIANSTNTALITNEGTMTVSGVTLSGAGAITNQNGGLLTWNASENTAHAITNSANSTLNFTGISTNTGTVQNSGSMTMSGQLNGAGTITNLASGNFTITDGEIVGAITNTGTISVAGTANDFALLTNNGGSVDIAAPFLSGTLNNNSGTVNLNAGTELDTTVNNTGTLNITGDITTAGDINNNAAGILTIAGNITLNGVANLNSLGAGSSVTVTGNQTITSAGGDYINSSIHNTSIYNDSYDSLTVTGGDIDLSGATLNVTANITNTFGEVMSFAVLSADAVTPPATYTGVTSDFYRIIDVIENPNSIVININAEEVTVPINAEIAGVLQNMFSNPTPNSGQQALEDAFLSINRNLNDGLHLMIPISNAFVYDAKMQGLVFNKIETRLAGLRDGWDHGKLHGGISAGDLCPGDSVWLSVSGSLTEQGPDEEDDGYNAKTAVILVGRDFERFNNVIGFAGGYSYTHLKELSNQHFIDNISRWHIMAYGSYNLPNCNYWDWLVTTNFNNNNTHRDINISGSNMTTYGKYHAYQLAGKLLRGKGFDFLDSYKFTPYTFAQYAFIHQDSYSESGSPAALNVEGINKNIFTLGIGAKFDFPLDAWSCIGMRELRATVVYDLINNNNDTTANFVVGSNSFTVTSTPVRLGLQLGAGIAFEFADNFIFELNYDFEVRSHFTDNTALLKLKYMF